MPDDTLKSAYTKARYLIDAPFARDAHTGQRSSLPQQVTLRIGQHSAPLARMMHALNARSVAILTAWNPGSRAPVSDAANIAAQKALETDAQALGLRVLPGRNLADQGDAHMEPTVILLDAGRDAAQALAHRYGQLAWVHAGADAVPELVWTGVAQFKRDP